MFSTEDQMLIEELGLQNLSEEYQTEGLNTFRETLATKVGQAMAAKLSDELLAEFEKVSDKGDDNAAQAWLRQAIPDYDKVVADQTAELKQEIAETSKHVQSVVDETYDS